jgi:hypothetical protein
VGPHVAGGLAFLGRRVGELGAHAKQQSAGLGGQRGGQFVIVHGRSFIPDFPESFQVFQ